MRMSLIGSDIWTFDPQLVALLGGLEGVFFLKKSTSLGGRLVLHQFVLSAPCLWFKGVSSQLPAAMIPLEPQAQINSSFSKCLGYDILSQQLKGN